MSKIYDLIGKRFGNLTVIEKLDSMKLKSGRTAIKWRCLCDCGNYTEVTTANLNNGHTSHCEKCASAITGMKHRKNIIGQKYGKLIVKEMIYNYNNTNRTKCLCDCECGNTDILKNPYDITSGKIISCGCVKGISQRTKMVGNKYGKLIVIEEMFDEDKPKVLCKCDCGNTIILDRHDVLTRHTNSCGCLTRSLREEFIEQILIDNKIKYKTQYTFSDCKSENNYVLRFDFAIFNEENSLIQLIEYDGQQHFHPIDGWGGEKAYCEIINRDNIKNEYCNRNNIKLLRLPYTLSNDEIKQRIYNVLESVTTAGVA